jgi:PAS domain S-box-containing protein
VRCLRTRVAAAVKAACDAPTASARQLSHSVEFLTYICDMSPSLRLARRQHDAELSLVCTDANDDACEWLGSSRSELADRPLRDLSPALAEALSKLSPPSDGDALVTDELSATMMRKGQPCTVWMTVIHDGDSVLLTWRELDADQRDGELLRAFLDNSLDVMVLANDEGAFEVVSRSLCELLDYSARELCSRPFLEFVHPDDRARTVAVFEAMFASGKTVTDFENRYLTRDGSVRWLRWASRPPGEDGLIYATAKDVTAPKLLDGQRALMFASLDSTKFGVVMTDSAGVLEWCNHGFTQICGYTAVELVGKQLGPLLQGPDTNRDERARVRQCVCDGVAFQTELLNFHKSGRPYWIRIEAEPIHDEEGNRHFLAIEVDVTDERLRATALATSEARLRATLIASKNAIYWLKPRRDATGDIEDFEFTDVNPAAERELGMKREQLVGARINVLFPINVSGGFFEKYKHVAETGDAYEQEYEITREHTAPGYYQHSVMRVGDELVIFNRDLTEDKAREAEQRRSLRMAALGRLASGIAHDFNNVLAGIGFSAELLQRELDDDKALTIVNDIATSTRRAGQFAKQILMFSRPSDSGLEPHALDETCDETLGMLARSISSAITLHVELEPHLIVLTDPAQIQQILTNLVTNASHALPEGSGNIWVSLRSVPASELRESHGLDDSEDRYALLEVRDDGVGIPDHELEHIFDPFYSTKAPEQGTGLGLSIVHRIVTHHAGYIAVRSKPSEGTTFSIALPLADADVQPAEAEPDEVHVLPDETGVLIVDDNQMIVSTLGRMLERGGFRVFTSSDGATAVSLFSDYAAVISVAIIDLNMPGLSGLELGKALREIRPELTILLMTGGGTPLPSEALLEAGIARVLEKPFSSREVVRELGTLLAASA